MSCSISNDWNMRTRFSIRTMVMGGIMSGSVIRANVMKLEAPEARLASSNDASILRNAGVSSITFDEMTVLIRCTQTMPWTLKMLNGADVNMGNSRRMPTFSRPRSGSNSIIQPIVVNSDGSMNETQNRNSSACANGIRMRASAQAIKTAMGNPIVVYMKYTT